MRFLAFDCLVIDDQNVMSKTLDKRYGVRYAYCFEVVALANVRPSRGFRHGCTSRMQRCFQTTRIWSSNSLSGEATHALGKGEGTDMVLGYAV
jgi:hypothetical protein